MRTTLPLLVLTTACVWSSSGSSSPEPDLHPVLDVTEAGEPPPDDQPAHFRVLDPRSLADFVPPTYLGVSPSEKHTPTPDAVSATYDPPGRRITLDIARIRDVAATRASFELLGRDTVGRIDGSEIRGLRFQGNPAQASRSMSAPHTGTLSVVAANTYLVTFTVTPAADTAEVVALAGGLDVGSLTRLAIREHKARTGQDAVE